MDLPPSSSCPARCACSPAATDPHPAPGIAPEATARSTFRIPGMDCPAEEQMIRLQLAGCAVSAMHFDLTGRTLTIDHAGTAATILERLRPLGYGAELSATAALTDALPPVASSADDRREARVLRTLLAINALMFVIELGAGWWAHSAGLIADAMDMFADAAVYGVALYAVGRAAAHKVRAARLAGVLQLLLALGALGETARRIYTGSMPEDIAMIAIALLALVANIACLALVSRHRDGGAHMRASYIFSANDVLANLGVITAGVLVSWSGQAWPDWVIGTLIGVLVLSGAIRILRLR